MMYNGKYIANGNFRKVIKYLDNIAKHKLSLNENDLHKDICTIREFLSDSLSSSTNDEIVSIDQQVIEQFLEVEKVKTIYRNLANICYFLSTFFIKNAIKFSNREIELFQKELRKIHNGQD